MPSSQQSNLITSISFVQRSEEEQFPKAGGNTEEHTDVLLWFFMEGGLTEAGHGAIWACAGHKHAKELVAYVSRLVEVTLLQLQLFSASELRVRETTSLLHQPTLLVYGEVLGTRIKLQ